MASEANPAASQAPPVGSKLLARWIEDPEPGVLETIRDSVLPTHRKVVDSVLGFVSADGSGDLVVLYEQADSSLIPLLGPPADLEDEATIKAVDASPLHSYELKFTNIPQGTGRLQDMPVLFLATLHPHPDWAEQLREWLYEEHFHVQPTTPGLDWMHSYESIEGPFHYLNLWSVKTPDVPTSEEYLKIRTTPWAQRLEEGLQASKLVRSVFLPLGGTGRS